MQEGYGFGFSFLPLIHAFMEVNAKFIFLDILLRDMNQSQPAGNIHTTNNGNLKTNWKNNSTILLAIMRLEPYQIKFAWESYIILCSEGKWKIDNR